MRKETDTEKLWERRKKRNYRFPLVTNWQLLCQWIFCHRHRERKFVCSNHTDFAHSFSLYHFCSLIFTPFLAAHDQSFRKQTSKRSSELLSHWGSSLSESTTTSSTCSLSSLVDCNSNLQLTPSLSLQASSRYSYRTVHILQITLIMIWASSFTFFTVFF